MTIRINQIAVDFTLEKEKTLADLTTALRAWAAGQNLAVLGILADGRALAADDATPLDQVQVIDVEAVPAGERDLARVAVIARYFALVVQGLTDGDQALVSELQREYPAVREALFPLLSPLAHRLTPALGTLDGPWAPASALAEAAGVLADTAETRRRELQAPEAALEETLKVLDGAPAQVEALAAHFQRGQDREGFTEILALFTALEDLGRRVPPVLGRHEIDLGPWEAAMAGLQPFLQEAEQALTSGDYVLMTDLLEYEIVPRVSEVRGLIPAIVLDPVPGVL